MQIALSRFKQFDAVIGVHLVLHECMPLTYAEPTKNLTGLTQRFAPVPQIADILRRARRNYQEFQHAREYMRRTFASVYREPEAFGKWYEPEEFGKLVGSVNLWLVLHAPERRGELWRKQALLALQDGAQQFLFTVASSAKSAYIVISQETIPDDATIAHALRRADQADRSTFLSVD